MQREETVAGEVLWTLDEVLEAPWKLYRVDPWGPLGGELKVASVINLELGTWEELAVARKEEERRAIQLHEEWSRSLEGSPPALDGSFAYVVIGSVAKRLSVQFPKTETSNETSTRTETLNRVSNQLTDNWLPGDFGQWAGMDWRSAGPGYWFWNKGEQSPFDWEPHTYHAFVELLGLLAGEEAVVDEARAIDALQKSLRALKILAPKVGVRWPPRDLAGLRADERGLQGDDATEGQETWRFKDSSGNSVDWQLFAGGKGERVEVNLAAVETSLRVLVSWRSVDNP